MTAVPFSWMWKCQALRANAVLYHNLVVRGVEATIRARAAAERAGQ